MRSLHRCAAVLKITDYQVSSYPVRSAVWSVRSAWNSSRYTLAWAFTRVSSIFPTQCDVHLEGRVMSGKQRYGLGAAVAVAAAVLTAAVCSAPGASSSSPAASGTGGASGSTASGPVKIAVVDAQSGSNSDLGQFEWRGVSLAVNQANAAGGVDGRK